MFYNPKIELGCAEWCQYAEKCVPDLVKAKKAAQNFKEMLSERAKSHLSGDPAAWDRTAKGVAYALDLLKAEGGDPKVVLATVLLHRVEPDKAREFLAELETEPEIIEAVLELLTGRGAERDLNRQLFQDVLALLEEKGGAPRQFITRTAHRLAGAAGSEK
jgi:hypothetical protein